MDTVVVTGASSGVGEACTLKLAEKGYQTLACVRKVEDGNRLKSVNPELIRPVIVDVQDQNTIEQAAEQIGFIVGNNGLKGLVNCAGTIFSGPIEDFPRELWFKQYDVNLIGTMAITQALIPLIKTGRGRIVNIGAVGGGIALPFFGAIASAKIAFEAASDCLRRKLHPWGVHVAIIEPGGINTPANRKMRDSVVTHLNRAQSDAARKYRQAMERFTAWAYQKHVNNLQPTQIAETVFKALTTRHPQTRYRRGWDSRGAALAKWLLPDRIFDWIIMRMASLPTRFGKWAE